MTCGHGIVMAQGFGNSKGKAPALFFSKVAIKAKGPWT